MKIGSTAPTEVLTFNRPYATGQEFGYLQQALDGRHLSGNGPFTRRCCEWLERQTGSDRALLTFSCTSALEMATILAGIGPGDEVILPSFTFVSTASAVALRGGKPVFVDIRADTLNLDERAIEAALTSRTRAILPVHYAGVAAAMRPIIEIAEAHGLTVIEDAAQGVLASYEGRPLGSIGALGCLSFHETKNLQCGEGGAVLVNRADLVEKAEILQEKGTNRARFFRGEVDKYTWVGLGSSFLTSEINAAFLWAQLESAEEITRARLRVWDAYNERFADLERAGRLRRPIVPEAAEHNAHIYYLLLADLTERTRVTARLHDRGIQAVFHYVPLHSSPAGRRYGRVHETLPVTERVADSLLRLPLWVGMTEDDVGRVVSAVSEALA